MYIDDWTDIYRRRRTTDRRQLVVEESIRRAVNDTMQRVSRGEFVLTNNGVVVNNPPECVVVKAAIWLMGIRSALN